MKEQIENSLKVLKEKNLIKDFQIQNGTVQMELSDTLLEEALLNKKPQEWGSSINSEYTIPAYRLLHIFIKAIKNDKESLERGTIEIPLNYLISSIKGEEYQEIRWDFEAKSYFENVFREFKRISGINLGYEFSIGEDFVCVDSIEFFFDENSGAEDKNLFCLNRKEVAEISSKAIEECHKKKPSLFKKAEKHEIYKDTEGLIIDKLFKNRKEITLTEEVLYLAFFEVVNSTVYGYMNEEAANYIDSFRNGFPEDFYNGDKELLKEKAYRFDYLYVLSTYMRRLIESKGNTAEKKWYMDAVVGCLVLRGMSSDDALKITSEYKLKERLDKYPELQMSCDIDALVEDMLSKHGEIL